MSDTFEPRDTPDTTPEDPAVGGHDRPADDPARPVADQAPDPAPPTGAPAPDDPAAPARPAPPEWWASSADPAAAPADTGSTPPPPPTGPGLAYPPRPPAPPYPSFLLHHPGPASTPPPPPDGPSYPWAYQPVGGGASGGDGGPSGPAGPGDAYPPWQGGGHWGPPAQWGGQAVWIPAQNAPRNHPLRVLAVSLAVVIVAAIGVAVGRTSTENGVTNPVIDGSSQSSQPGSGADTSTIAAKVDPGVVDITTRLGFNGGEAAGTGVVLTSSGEVLTNNHVVAGATSISVTDVGNGQTYTANVVGTDRTDDIAVIRLVGASGLKTVSLGNSSTLAVGTSVTAIGNAGGVGGTPSVAGGAVTALDQAITASDQSDGSTEQLTGLIQTDAALQPGDSGGPLVDSQGQVVGIDTAASSGFQFQSGASQGFAIPIDHAMTIARQIMSSQASNSIHIGASALIGVRVTDSSLTAGAAVAEVEPGTPADQAGVVAGDVIVSLGGQSVDSPNTLSNLMTRHHPGDTVQLVWIDQSGTQHSATVKLVTGPAT